MALDGILLHKIIPEIQSALPMRIQKIWEISNTEILFQTHGDAGKQQEHPAEGNVFPERQHALSAGGQRNQHAQGERRLAQL